MSEYQLQIKQIVDYPRCRIYRQFIQSLMSDQSIRVGGGSGLFLFYGTLQLCKFSYILPAYRRNQLYGLSRGVDLYSKRGIWLVSDTFSETGD